MSTRRRMMMQPKGGVFYKQVGWVGTDRYSWFKISISNSNMAYVKARLMQSVYQDWSFIRYGIGANLFNSSRFYYQYGNSPMVYGNYGVRTNIWYDYVFGKSLIIDGNVKVNTNGTLSSNFYFQIPQTSNDGFYITPDVKIQYLQVLNGDDTLLFDGVPCILLRDLVNGEFVANKNKAKIGCYGLYDKISGKFYGDQSTDKNRASKILGGDL